jgi:hypothetical protein
MTKDYREIIRELTAWFAEKLGSVEKVEMTEEQYLQGIDALPPHVRQLTDEAFKIWLNDKGCELSYNQMCRAFFEAARGLNKLHLTSRHPLFRLHTRVLVKEVESVDGTEKNVPGVITSVRGDTHLVTLGNEMTGRRAVLIRTADLEKELSLAS